MHARRRSNEGVALLLAIIAALVVLGAVALVFQQVYGAKNQTDAAVSEVQIEEACKAGIEIGVERIWNQYVIGNGNTTGNLASYYVFIDGVVLNSEDTNGNGSQDGEEFDRDGDGMFETASPAVLIDAEDNVELPGGARIVQLTVERTDDVTGTILTLRSTASAGGDHTRTAAQAIRVSGRLFQGFEYAVLANNINCILCHARIEPLDLNRNNDPGLYGTFDRIKIASLESMMIRTNENIGCSVAGSTYTRGSVYNQANTLLTAAGIASSPMKACAFSNTNGKLTQGSNGSLSTVNMANAGLDAQGRLKQFGNLYMNYPTDESAMTDGNLPTSFPAPFPDDNGNRNVDDDEFTRVKNSANGSLHFTLTPGESGSLKAGVAYGVPSGSSYSGAALPTASNSALDALKNTGSYDGNLILVGTSDDPIVIDKKVAINGDLLVKGPIKGWGQLLVRGNVYVMGDVTYADANGKFGEAADGTKNGLALTAGGSVMMGDYLTIRSRHHSKDTSKFPSGAFIDCRTANVTKKLTVSGKTETVAYGYFDAGVVDAGVAQGTNTEYSFTTSELMLFNRMEKKKASLDGNYKPRYYRLRPTMPLYTYNGTDEHAVKYDDAGVATFAAGANAVVHDLCPKNYWVSEDQLRKFWYADEMTRPATGRPFKFDGLLYSNNSIFGIVRSSDRHKSNTRGIMTIRGGVVAADLGMLVPGADFSEPREAFNLFYDRRVGEFLRVEDTTQVEFTRLVYQFE